MGHGNNLLTARVARHSHRWPIAVVESLSLEGIKRMDVRTLGDIDEWWPWKC